MSQLRDAIRVEFSKAQLFDFKSIFDVAKWFFDKIREAVNASLLVGVSKAEFLEIIGESYDAYVLPMDLPGPDSLFDPILKQLALKEAGRLYDTLTASKSA